MNYAPWALIRAFAVKLNYLNFRSVLGYSQCIKCGSTTGVNEPTIKQKGIPYYTTRKKKTNKKMSHSKLLKK